MTSIELEKKWSGLLQSANTNGFKSLRLSPDCFCELYIGVGKESKRSLILALPESKRLSFKGVTKENLSIEYFPEKNFLVVQLIDSSFYDLFDDYILSLFYGIKSIKDVDEYATHFTQAFYRWSEFFEDKRSDTHSEDSIRGLIGELIVLKSLINSQSQPDINFILSSWKGPYDKRNDFELETKNIEVKTKSPAGIDVKISSEFQLELSPGKGLELIVVSLLSDSANGITIRDLIFDIKNLVQEVSGDISIFWTALSKKNISSKNANQYDRFKFKPVSSITYDCSSEGFPKLNRSNIPEEISSLKYELRTNLLTPFIIEQRQL